MQASGFAKNKRKRLLNIQKSAIVGNVLSQKKLIYTKVHVVTPIQPEYRRMSFFLHLKGKKDKQRAYCTRPFNALTNLIPQIVIMDIGFQMLPNTI